MGNSSRSGSVTSKRASISCAASESSKMNEPEHGACEFLTAKRIRRRCNAREQVRIRIGGVRKLVEMRLLRCSLAWSGMPVVSAYILLTIVVMSCFLFNVSAANSCSDEYVQ